MRATSHMPALIAAIACSTCTRKDEPPIEVLSLYLGLMPMYSAVASVLKPAVKRPSTSLTLRPASARALKPASAWCMSDDLPGTTPISSDSATPTMATLLDKSLVICPIFLANPTLRRPEDAPLRNQPLGDRKGRPYEPRTA